LAVIIIVIVVIVMNTIIVVMVPLDQGEFGVLSLDGPVDELLELVELPVDRLEPHLQPDITLMRLLQLVSQLGLYPFQLLPLLLQLMVLLLERLVVPGLDL
jgi:hypothetical protein